MAKFEVKQKYKDVELDKELQVGDKVEMTVKRSEEVEKTLSDKGFNGPFLKRLDEKKK
ncbi:hypothetical protein ACUXJ9_001437 [Staphylococcus caledonicus]|uniref:hypothetical protein n=1 Tax=Staphylococcus TaxID=1279 RepID=UPI000A58998D|nr:MULTISPECIES: hypothetical protein [Staphylococcus]MCE4993191.1 hypothetical protein [Staphylococcus haemolyticus]